MVVFYKKLVPYVINRTGDGRCPIESSVIEIDDSQIGYQVIHGTLEKLKQKSIA